ncbi:MAG: hypothetical protein WA941_05595 [Nitrososphaeraceae archaeon]
MSIYVAAFIAMIMVLSSVGHSTLTQAKTDSDEFKVRVWIADVKPDSDDVELCVDVIETGAFKCKRFDATIIEPDESLTDVPVVNAGLFEFSTSQAPVNSTVVACLYVFKTYTGDCSESTIGPGKNTTNILLFTRINPAYYNKDDGRVYEYDREYHLPDGTNRSFVDEGVAVPSPNLG